MALCPQRTRGSDHCLLGSNSPLRSQQEEDLEQGYPRMGEKPGGESGLGEDEFSLSLGPNGQGKGDEEAKGRWDLATK